jgi:hypothetical protein
MRPLNCSRTDGGSDQLECEYYAARNCESQKRKQDVFQHRHQRDFNIRVRAGIVLIIPSAEALLAACLGDKPRTYILIQIRAGTAVARIRCLVRRIAEAAAIHLP